MVGRLMTNKENISDEGLRANTISVGALFSGNNFYKIPNYQRPFSWEKDQFSDLVSDFIASDRSKEYFLGTIVLHKSENELVVVDGQQRLTSLLILLACLRDKISDESFSTNLNEKIIQKENKLDKIPAKNRLRVREMDLFDKLVITAGGTLESFELDDLNEAQSKYILAAKTFHQELDNLDQSELLELAGYISTKSAIVSLTADSFEQAFRLFEIVNDRGKQLRRIDVLKSKTISPDVVAEDHIRDHIAAKWKNLEDDIGSKEFESVFFLLRLILIKEKPQFDLLREFEKRVFEKKLVKPGKPFADMLFNYVELYRSIFVDQEYLGEDTIEGRKYRSLIYIMNSEFRASEWKACIIEFAKKFKREAFYDFLLKIEKVFLRHWVEGIRRDDRYIDYVTILNSIKDSKSATEAIKSIYVDLSSIEKACFVPNFYGVGYKKYFLLRLELSACEFEKVEQFQAKSIEHIFPQTVEPDTEWDTWRNQKEPKEFVHKLGNLVLLSKSRNSSASNKKFSEKKTKYLSPRVTGYPRSIEVLTYDEWNPNVIEDRCEEAAKRIVSDP